MRHPTAVFQIYCIYVVWLTDSLKNNLFNCLSSWGIFNCDDDTRTSSRPVQMPHSIEREPSSSEFQVHLRKTESHASSYEQKISFVSPDLGERFCWTLQRGCTVLLWSAKQPCLACIGSRVCGSMSWHWLYLVARYGSNLIPSKGGWYGLHLWVLNEVLQKRRRLYHNKTALP